ncbi:hypothetical protein IC608_16055 [Devosia sp. PTR5]|uniref:Uncharacterized protein n=1 Tax=Devosia oryzisoli TaxID=2774138 RepID=A0A927FVC1_9HYPH|nr:hypothetical protein [Devosia oryzisoli]MBD8066985.1 hypothetical protein [Devosia oryzisoli]
MDIEIFILRSDWDRFDDLMNATAERGFFAEAVDDDLHRRGGPRLPCLIGFSPGELSHFGTLSVGNKAAEGRKRINVSGADELPVPLRITGLVDAITAPHKTEVQTRLRQGGLIRTTAAKKLLDVIRKINPERASAIEHLSLEQSRIEALPDRVQNALAIEKEMVSAALEFSGLGKAAVTNWHLPENENSSFLDGLGEVRLREDAMIVHDMNLVPGFELSRRVGYSAALFEDGHTRLSVVLANHLRLEEQLGGDLDLLQREP